MTGLLSHTRILPAAAAAVFACSFAAGAPAASADTGTSGPLTGSYVSPGDGLGGVVPDASNVLWPAWSQHLTVEGQDVSAFCIQFSTDINKTATYTAKSWTAAGVANLGKVADIASRHASMGTALSDDKFEAAATQVAIWSLTDNIDPSRVDNTTIRSRVAALLSAAQTVSEPVSTVNISAAATPQPGDKSMVVVNVSTTSGPAANVPVTVTVNGEQTTGSTSTDGKAQIEVSTPPDGTTAQVTADLAVDSGVVVAPDSGQAMIVADPVSISRSTTVQFGAAVVPAPTASAVATPQQTPTASATAVPATDDTQPGSPAKSLPETGSDIAPATIGIVLLVGAAAAAAAVTVRRRTRT